MKDKDEGLFLTYSQLRKVRMFSRKGLSETAIAASIGITPKKWKRVKKEQPDVTQMLELGRARDLDECVDILNYHIKTGNYKALEFKLKARHDWRDNTPVLIDNSTNNIIKLPEQIPAEEYRKLFSPQQDVIEGEVVEPNEVTVERH